MKRKVKKGERVTNENFRKGYDRIFGKSKAEELFDEEIKLEKIRHQKRLMFSDYFINCSDYI